MTFLQRVYQWHLPCFQKYVVILIMELLFVIAEWPRANIQLVWFGITPWKSLRLWMLLQGEDQTQSICVSVFVGTCFHFWILQTQNRDSKIILTSPISPRACHVVGKELLINFTLTGYFIYKPWRTKNSCVGRGEWPFYPSPAFDSCDFMSCGQNQDMGRSNFSCC